MGRDLKRAAREVDAEAWLELDRELLERAFWEGLVENGGSGLRKAPGLYNFALPSWKANVVLDRR